jgi:hypothetical protein
LFYVNNFFTIVEIILLPLIVRCNASITLPIDAIPVAPVSAIIFAITASISASLNCAGKNFRLLLFVPILVQPNPNGFVL